MTAAPYTIQTGDTLSGIASANNTNVAALMKANPHITNPDVIQAGGSLTLPGATTDYVQPVGAQTVTPGYTAPTKTNIGIGTLTTIPKAPLSTPAPTGTTPAVDLSGAYARTGVTPPAPVSTNASAPTTPTLPTVPQYPTPAPDASSSKITDAYNTLLDSMSAIEAKIASASTPSSDEVQLQQQLAAKKDQLSKFDIGSLQATEDLYGQGRGTTTTTLGRQEVQQNRTRSLARLGMAQEADTLTNQLGLAQDARKNLGDLATTEYNLASKKLDVALGVAKEMDTLHQSQQDNARQYLLDLVGHFDGKTYDQLDDATKQSINNAVANSPITLDMVKTALTTSAASAAATADGRMYSVSGLGIVMVNKDGSGYKVVVPETVKPGSGTPTGTPTFEDYVSKQNLPIPSLTTDRLAQLKTEYDAKYSGANAGSKTFTQTQVNKGAAVAGVPLATFSSYDDDSKNTFINGDISGAKKSIDAAVANKATIADLTSGIQDMKLPKQVEQYLIDYATKTMPAPAQPGFFDKVLGWLNPFD